MKKNLSIRLAVILFGMAACIVLAGVLFSRIFLEAYYIDNKENDMINLYNLIDNNVKKNRRLTEKQMMTIINGCEKNNISLIVIDSSLNIKVSSGFSVQGDNLLSRVKDLIFSEDIPKEELIEQNESYYLYEIYDESSNNSYLEMYGNISSGDVFVMRSSLESIRNSVDLFRKFYLNVGLSLVIISIFVSFYCIRNVTRPLKNLVEVSERMSKLDFDAKYEGSQMDEVGRLGQSMNTMSETLKMTFMKLEKANYELRKDNEQKTEIDEMRKEFLSNVSHELKTPIALISGYAEGLKECVFEDKDNLDYYCDVILDEANKMNKMVMKLLTLNQIESGGMEADIERFDIVDLIEQILANFKVKFDEKNIKIKFDNSNPVFVWSDEFQIAEVITNYVSNAINHIGEENIITIAIQNENEKVKVVVLNTGKKIPEDELEKIWIKFYKVDKARTREYGGSGIGLSIVKAIMESLGQEYGVYNNEEGVAFYFTVNREMV